MSDSAAAADRHPSVAIIELDSIAAGIETGDAMVKASPLGSIYAGTVHPGKYLVLVSGDTGPVDEAVQVGREIGGGAIVDVVFLPDIHPAVAAAIASADDAAWISDDALGIVETASVAAAIEAADAGVKAARVDLAGVRMADGLGGKGYTLFSGEIAEVEAAVEVALDRVEPHGGLVAWRIIPQLHPEIKANLRAELHFRGRVVRRDAERGR